MRSPKRQLLFILCLMLLLAATAASAQEIRYFYDDLGRVIGVVDQQGNAARYVYDAVGNILEIRRTNLADFAGPVAITFFDPDRGRVGTTVTIFGAGFSPVPTNNQVTFNGTPAVVSASTSQTITTSVPNGATTGPIAVTTPLGTATSRENFTIAQPVVINPTVASVLLGGTVQFTANTAVEWRVSPPLGTISPEGLYRAPPTVPVPPEVIITAVNTLDRSLEDSAAVTILPVPERFASRSVSVQFAEPALQANPTQSPLVSVQVAEPALRANPAPSPLVSVQVAEPAVQANPEQSPLVSVQVAEPALQANPDQAPLVATIFAPFITGLSPTSGVAGGAAFLLTVNGEGFTGATDLQFVLGDGSNDLNVTASGVTPAADGRSLTAAITIAAVATSGPRTVRVVTPAGTSTIQPLGANVFTVTVP